MESRDPDDERRPAAPGAREQNGGDEQQEEGEAEALQLSGRATFQR